MYNGICVVLLLGCIQTAICDQIVDSPVCMVLTKSQNAENDLLIVKMRNECEAGFVSCNRGGELVDIDNCKDRRPLSSDDVTIRHLDKRDYVCARDRHQMHRRLRSRCYMEKLNCFNPDIQFKEVPWEHCLEHTMNKRQILQNPLDLPVVSNMRHENNNNYEKLQQTPEDLKMYLPFLRSNNLTSVAAERKFFFPFSFFSRPYKKRIYDLRPRTEKPRTYDQNPLHVIPKKLKMTVDFE